MNSTIDLVLLQDLIRLPRETLQEVATDLGIETSLSAKELARAIWMKISQDNQQRQVLSSIDDRVLGGKTSVTWYTLDSGATLIGAKEILIESLGFDPFAALHIPADINQLTNQPTLIGACQGQRPDQYYLRFMYKSGVTQVFYGTEARLLPKTAIKTLYIDETANLLEIRTDSRSASKFARSLAGLLNQQIAISQTDVLAPFGYEIERIADALGGELIDATAKPEIMLESLDEETVDLIIRILSALNAYFEEGDIDNLVAHLQEARATFDENNLISIPFTALILSGLDKIGMGVTGRDLRGLPIYNYFRPHIQNQGGFIQFPVNEGGVINYYTIRVGLETKSIYFMTPASEAAINYVRERII